MLGNESKNASAESTRHQVRRARSINADCAVEGSPPRSATRAPANAREGEGRRGRGRRAGDARKAKAQAEANRLLQESLTALLIQNKAIDRWNGTLPQFTGGGAVPFLNLKDMGGGTGEGHSTVPGH